MIKQVFENWLKRAKQLKTEVRAIYLACRDPRVPWYARILAVCVVGYAFSPIDLIPDFIPVLGLLDDAILIPCGIWLLIKIIPPEILAECREKAQLQAGQEKPTNWIGAGIIIAIWLLLAVFAAFFLLQVFKKVGPNEIGILFER